MQILAFVPVWIWYARRITDSSDEPWGLAALAVGVGLHLMRPATRAQDHVSLVLPALVVLLYAVGYPFLPRLLLAVLAVTALSLTLGLLKSGRPLHVPTMGLLLLSLPLIPSLQFYLGYPLRLIAAAIATPMLQMAGFAVVSHGTSLQWGHDLISIDAPCSGVRMLWTGMFVAFTAAGVLNLSGKRTLAAAAAAFGLIVLGNGVRSAALFYVESGILEMPPWVHSGVGVSVFFAITVGIAWMTTRLSGKHVATGVAPSCNDLGGTVVPPVRLRDRQACPWPRSGDACATHDYEVFGEGSGEDLFSKRFSPDYVLENESGSHAADARRHSRRRDGSPETIRCFGLSMITCLLAALVPFVPLNSDTPLSPFVFPGWPGQHGGLPVQEVPLTAQEKGFADGFPGRIGKFTDGHRTVILRWVTRETRRLHPASDCFRGMGFTVKPLPILVDSAGEAWGTLEAAGKRESLFVRERISDGKGNAWTDVSSWYWAALLGRTSGPWWSETIVETGVQHSSHDSKRSATERQ